MGKILVADDEKEARNFLSKLLRQDGYEVIEAEDGYGAVKAVIKEKPDVILMDAIMPGVSGIEAVEIIRRDLKAKNIPVLMVTAYEETRMNGIEAGIDDFIPKTGEPEEILMRVRAMLKIKDIDDELKRTLVYAEELSRLREEKGKMK